METLPDMVAALGVALSAAVLEWLKRRTSALDGKIGSVVRPVQPALIAVVGVAAPHITGALGVTVDPAQLVTAPTATLAATVLTLGVREVGRRLAGKKK